jgi:hypothetical protein
VYPKSEESEQRKIAESERTKRMESFELAYQVVKGALTLNPAKGIPRTSAGQGG